MDAILILPSKKGGLSDLSDSDGDGNENEMRDWKVVMIPNQLFEIDESNFHDYNNNSNQEVVLTPITYRTCALPSPETSISFEFFPAPNKHDAGGRLTTPMVSMEYLRSPLLSPTSTPPLSPNNANPMIQRAVSIYFDDQNKVTSKPNSTPVLPAYPMAEQQQQNEKVESSFRNGSSAEIVKVHHHNGEKPLIQKTESIIISKPLLLDTKSIQQQASPNTRKKSSRKKKYEDRISIHIVKQGKYSTGGTEVQKPIDMDVRALIHQMSPESSRRSPHQKKEPRLDAQSLLAQMSSPSSRQHKKDKVKSPTNSTVSSPKKEGTSTPKKERSPRGPEPNTKLKSPKSRALPRTKLPLSTSQTDSVKELTLPMEPTSKN